MSFRRQTASHINPGCGDGLAIGQGRHIFHFYYIPAVYQSPAARQPQAEHDDAPRSLLPVVAVRSGEETQAMLLLVVFQ